MFAMLFVSVQLQNSNFGFNNGEAERQNTGKLNMRDSLLERTVQCLHLARYTTGGPYILETLIMVLTGEFTLVGETATDCWLLINMILHISMRMGYHRDPDNFPGISPFNIEMLRRVWTTILQLDLVISLELRLPRSATDMYIDVKEPRNLHDTDFDERTTEMPPRRPETEWTPMLPLIARGRIVSALGSICDVNSNTNPPPYDELVKIDAFL
jgi:hypothetical protein